MSVATSPEPQPELDGKYALLREIGHGASGHVYEAEQLLTGKLVAVKVMNREAFADSARRDQFVSEARAGAGIAHENRVAVHALGLTSDDRPYLVMELLCGETLERLIDSRGALPAAQACEIVRQLLAAVAAAHAQGFVHGDLKPSNVMVLHPGTDRMHVKVLDFGLARPMNEADAKGSGTVGGTPMYMSPEQVRGESLDARSDVYSVSAILYALLAGRDPFEGQSGGAVLKRVRSGAFAPLCQVNPSVPKRLATLVERGLALDPKRRLESAQEYIELLQPFLNPPTRVLVLGSERPRLSEPAPRINALREVTIQEVSSLPARGPSVIPIRVASYARGVTDSLLVAPRFPRSPSTPRLRVGKDFLPAPGEPAWDEVVERRQSTHAPEVRLRAGNVWPALVATGIGFSLGVIIAWLSGAV